MAVDQILLNRVREAFIDVPDVEEKKMFGGVCFMVDDKMCVCVRHEMMCCLNPETYTDELEKNDVRQMMHGGRHMKGYVYVGPLATKTDKDIKYWVDTALAYNKIAQPSASPKSSPKERT
jgi:TfoX/Sxy family transcriptional regulator of competence genes